MPHRAFALFVLPSALAMILFIALPILSIAVQSFFIQHPQVMVEVEACDPFGCVTETRVDSAAMAELRRERPLGQFNGFGTYTDVRHLALAEVGRAWETAAGIGDFLRQVRNLPFYGALVFTLAYTAVVTPLALGLGLAIALAVNAIPRALRGVAIYVTLLPMIVPGLLGALVLFWMIDARGIVGATLQWLLSDPALSLKASPALTWATVFAHGTWTSAPFVFIVYYAALQTVPRDALESAMIDGASRLGRFRLVVLPHLAPVTVFLVVISLMDNFRVFESIVGLSATAHASSLSVLVFLDLRSGEAPLYGSAAATSMLTILCIAALLTPSMIRSWQSFRSKG